MKSSLGVLALFLAVCTAQVPNLGFCPDYESMAEFDIDKFLGKWYEAERYFQFSELGTRCVVSDYARSPSGKISVSHEVTSRITSVKRILGGDMELAGRTGEGKLKVKYQTSPISTTTTYSVLDTDYDNFAVMWSCSGYGPIHTQNAWVMTRERLAPSNIMQKAYGVLDKYKISRTFFQKTDQEGCVLAASEINAAQGWIGEQAVTDPPQAVDKGDEAAIAEKSAGSILLDRSDVLDDKELKVEKAGDKIENDKSEPPLKENVISSDPKIALRKGTLESKKEEIKKPLEIAEHILKHSPAEDSVKIDEVKEKPAKPEVEGIQVKSAEAIKAHPKDTQSHKNVAKTK